MKPLDTLAIVGLGLMGASLGLAVRRRGLARRVVASARRADTRAEALAQGVADAVVTHPAEAVGGAELTVFCLPVLSIPEAVMACRPVWTGRELVTDVGSTKAAMEDAVENALAGSGVRFVGSHPICGSERTGLEAARADLYEGAVVVVSPPARGDAEAAQRVGAFWTALGARVRVMDAAAHDQVIARTSHLPHLVASALAALVLTPGDDASAALCGGGFRDTTRVAGGSETLWHDIIKTNRQAVTAALADFETELGQVRRLLDAADFDGLRGYLARVGAMRRAFGQATGAAPTSPGSGS